MEQSQFLKDCAASHAEVLHEASVRRLDLRLRHKEERKAYEQNTKESILVRQSEMGGKFDSLQFKITEFAVLVTESR